MTRGQASRDLIALLARHRRLAWVLARREIADRYAGQVLGVFWAIGHPLLQVAIFVFVFAVVFQVRVGLPGSGPADYALYLLAGLVPWLAVQESLTRSTVSIIGQSGLVKQVAFPTEVLPVKVVLAALCTQVIFLTGMVVYRVAGGHGVPWTFALVPLLLAIEVVGLVGLALALGAVGVFFRDLKDFVHVFTAVGLYLMPVAYQPDMVPAAVRPLLWLNPFSYLAWCFQDACYHGRFEHPWAWGVLPVLAFTSFAVGARVFRTLKPMFGGAL